MLCGIYLSNQISPVLDPKILIEYNYSTYTTHVIMFYVYTASSYIYISYIYIYLTNAGLQCWPNIKSALSDHCYILFTQLHMTLDFIFKLPDYNRSTNYILQIHLYIYDDGLKTTFIQNIYIHKLSLPLHWYLTLIIYHVQNEYLFMN